MKTQLVRLITTLITTLSMVGVLLVGVLVAPALAHAMGWCGHGWHLHPKPYGVEVVEYAGSYQARPYRDRTVVVHTHKVRRSSIWGIEVVDTPCPKHRR